MANVKHYLLTAAILAAIGGASAALIAGTNLITKQKIVQNEIDRVNAGIKQIFGQNSAILEENAVSGYEYVNYCYKIVDSGNTLIGYAYRTSGSNMYGKISLLVGFDESTKSFKKMSIIVNEQTYASTLEDKYVSVVNDGGNLDDTSCGATYGAKLVRNMVNEAYTAAQTNWSNE